MRLVKATALTTQRTASSGRRTTSGSARLDAEGYRTLGECLERAEAAGETWQALAAVRIIALTGCRRGEIESARRGEIDLAGQTFRFTDTKTGESIRPLGRPAVQAFREALARSSGEHVFPSHAGR